MKKEYRKKLLRFRVILLFVVIGFILDIAITAISYVVYTDNMNSSYGKVCKGITQVMKSSIDGNNVEEWLKEEKLDEYYTIKQNFVKIRNSVVDIDNIYVYQMQSDGIHVILDVGTTGLEKIKLGSVIEYGSKWQKNKNDLIAGRKVDNIVSDDKSGWLLTSVTPITNSKGKCVCYVGCDISMIRIAEERDTFMKQVIFPIVGATVLIILLAILYTLKHIVHPINRLDVYSRNFADDNNKKGVVKQKLTDLKIDSSWEINELRNDLIDLIDDISQYTYEVGKLKDNVINSIATIIGSKGINNKVHKNIMSSFVRIIMDELRKKPEYADVINDQFYNDIIKGAPIYDIGELSISNKVLNKPGRLTDDEFKDIKSHTVTGGEMIEETIKSTQTEQYTAIAKEMAEYHHEHFDGSGYPEGLKGKDIPLPARIIAVPDVFNALISKRTYKQSKTLDEAFNIILGEKDKQFDPDIVTAFVENRKKIEKLIKNYEDDSEDDE